MSDFMNTLFGPLSGEYCLYFYYLSIFSMFLFVLAVIVGFINGIRREKSLGFYVSVVGAALMYLVSYFVNRLMFSVCSKAL
jgi:hypothetical protein